MKQLYWYREWHWDNDIHAPHSSTSAAIFSIGGLAGNWSSEAGSVDTDSDSCTVKWFFFQLARLSPHTHTLTKTGFIWPRFAAPSLTDRNSMHVWLRGMFVLWMRCDTFSLDPQLYYQIQIVAWLVCLGSHCFGHHVSLTVHHRPLFWLPIKPSAASLYPRFPLNIYWSMPY